MVATDRNCFQSVLSSPKHLSPQLLASLTQDTCLDTLLRRDHVTSTPGHVWNVSLCNNYDVEMRDKTQDCSRQIGTYCHPIDICVWGCHFRRRVPVCSCSVSARLELTSSNYSLSLLLPGSAEPKLPGAPKS